MRTYEVLRLPLNMILRPLFWMVSLVMRMTLPFSMYGDVSSELPRKTTKSTSGLVVSSSAVEVGVLDVVLT